MRDFGPFSAGRVQGSAPGLPAGHPGRGVRRDVLLLRGDRGVAEARPAAREVQVAEMGRVLYKDP